MEPALETRAAGLRSQALPSTHCVPPVRTGWVSELSQDLLGPGIPLCLSDWLVLQTPSLVFQKGEPIVLRCHSWRNKPLYKITFFQNGKSKQFSPTNSTFSIPRANLSHSGEYHCTGLIGKSLQASQPVAITVQGGNPIRMERGLGAGQLWPRSYGPTWRPEKCHSRNSWALRQRGEEWGGA